MMDMTATVFLSRAPSAPKTSSPARFNNVHRQSPPEAAGSSASSSAVAAIEEAAVHRQRQVHGRCLSPVAGPRSPPEAGSSTVPPRARGPPGSPGSDEISPGSDEISSSWIWNSTSILMRLVNPPFVGESSSCICWNTLRAQRGAASIELHVIERDLLRGVPWKARGASSCRSGITSTTPGAASATAAAIAACSSSLAAG